MFKSTDQVLSAQTHQGSLVANKTERNLVDPSEGEEMKQLCGRWIGHVLCGSQPTLTKKLSCACILNMVSVFLFVFGFFFFFNDYYLGSICYFFMFFIIFVLCYDWPTFLLLCFSKHSIFSRRLSTYMFDLLFET